MIHVIRDRNGGLQATARGVSKFAAESWKRDGCEIYAFEIELPIEVGTDVIQHAKVIDG